ncbi:hypothetical protein QT970_30170, partial [Microcoleus sp. herbarium8]|uniref:hypothetical protein n=1 Tax=Microcoleus sp. herbarium8 TaxID=3055436 RepID=UPI002FD37957
PLPQNLWVIIPFSLHSETACAKNLPPLPWGTGGEKSPWGFRGNQKGASCLSSAGFGAAAPCIVSSYWK